MIVTSTANVEGKKIISYEGIVFGEVINGVNFIKDIGASLTNFFGGRSYGYEEELLKSRTEAENEMVSRALSKGANAIVGVKFDYETLGEGGTMLMVTCSGTAVRVE